MKMDILKTNCEKAIKLWKKKNKEKAILSYRQNIEIIEKP